MIDEKGRLFGKINLIDLLVLLVVLAAAAFLCLRLLDPGVESKSVPVRISFYAEETPDYVAEHMETGAVVYASTEDVNLGNVESFELFDSSTYVETEEGEVFLTSRDGYKSVVLTAVVNGVLTDNGVEVDGKLFGIGHTLVVYVGYSKLWMKVYDIEPVS